MVSSSDLIKSIAKEMGFSACGIARAVPLHEESQQFAHWINNGQHAHMAYMANYFDKRFNPGLLHEGTTSVISVLFNYNPQKTAHTTYKIAKYTYGEDYHILMKRLLLKLMDAIREHFPNFSGRAFVDTAPVAEKTWAARCGIGWIGKNSLLIHPEYGSFCFIGEIFCNLEYTYDTPIPNQCGSCTLCVDICPNQAITPNRGIDARKCISYHTIENKALLLPDSIQLKGNLFGCDYCQDICPYNRQAPKSLIVPQKSTVDIGNACFDEYSFKKQTKHSALNRITYHQIKRNMEHIQKDPNFFKPVFDKNSLTE